MGFIVALGSVTIILLLGVLLTGGPAKQPLEYANANAALAVQVVALCGLALATQPRSRHPAVSAVLALGVLTVVLNRSVAGTSLVLPLTLVIGLVVWLRPERRLWTAIAVATSAVAATVSAAVVVQAAEAPHFPGWADRAFDSARERLWQDAAALWRESPFLGSGPGSFAKTSALTADPDTMSAHSAVLQVGAETGWVGVGFMVLVALGGLVWAARGHAPEAIIAVAAWTALLVHSQVDHLLDFGSVVVAAGIVIGWAGASRSPRLAASSEQFDVTQSESPFTR
ncbi:hypothetical protein N802_01080 [Knoellia sinensis KCTC 19936]|uniref:O-antigen ligase-related domain-containing protein n=2 Tax=Knoellia TaxID=136099 RepID=A0A0A0JE20_9MICO|nr:hypothetical protein N802_01080 [Knoellia sinensis KCTC 19936]